MALASGSANPSSGSFAERTGGGRLFAAALGAGFAELALSRKGRVGVGLAAATLLISPPAFGCALLGALLATAWPYVRGRDYRLLLTGYYGVNGALCGLWAEWVAGDAAAAVVLTLGGALFSAVVVDLTIFLLGDRPLRAAPSSGRSRATPAIPTPSTVSAGSPSGRGASRKRRLVSPPPRAPRRPGPTRRTGSAGRPIRAGASARRGSASAAPSNSTRAAPMRWPAQALRRSSRGAPAKLVRPSRRRSPPTPARPSPGRALAGHACERAGWRRPKPPSRRSSAPTRGARGGIEGPSAVRRRLLLAGEVRAGTSAEWEALERLFGRRVLALPLLLLPILAFEPWAALLGVLALAGGVACGLVLAGPASLLWLDLHVQTLAVTALLGGVLVPGSWRGALEVAAACAAAALLWAACHLLGLWAPLLQFNLVGVAWLALRGRARARAVVRVAATGIPLGSFQVKETAASG